MFAAVLYKTEAIDWRRWEIGLRIAPVAALVATAIIQILGYGTGAWVSSLGFFLVSIGCAAFVLAIAGDRPRRVISNRRFSASSATRRTASISPI